MSFGDRDGLFVGVDDPDGAGDLRHVTDTTESARELDHLAIEDEQFLLRHAATGNVAEVNELKFLESLDSFVHRLEVGEHPAEPAVVDVGHANAGGFACDRFLSLLLGSDEEHRATVRHRFLQEFVRAVNVGQRLLQVDDVDAVALGEDEPPHLGVPPAGLVSEVHAALKQLLHRDDGHDLAPLAPFGAARFTHRPVGRCPDTRRTRPSPLPET